MFFQEDSVKKNRTLQLLLVALLVIAAFAAGYKLAGGHGDPSQTPPSPVQPNSPGNSGSTESVDEKGSYYDKDHVALYIHIYGKLPDNFVTKSEARAAGWSGGSVEKYIKGAAIGGDVFSNREGKLPQKNGRTWYECDIDTLGKNERGAKRIVFSDDGLIYYTADHYGSFELLYGEE
ncbi:MAG: ribonuclease [Eubacteriaceae bacterium]|nr:ribonuclease [Eubacteriaceae bacterium]